MTQQDKPHLEGMIPNFCGLVEVFILMISAQLLAFVFALMANADWATFWLDLGLISFQIQWMALLGAAVLCLSRKGLNRQSDTKAALLSYVMLMLVVMLVSESAYQIHYFLNHINLDHGSYLIRNFVIAAVIIAVFLRYLYVI